MPNSPITIDIVDTPQPNRAALNIGHRQCQKSDHRSATTIGYAPNSWLNTRISSQTVKSVVIRPNGVPTSGSDDLQTRPRERGHITVTVTLSDSVGTRPLANSRAYQQHSITAVDHTARVLRRAACLQEKDISPVTQRPLGLEGPLWGRYDDAKASSRPYHGKGIPHQRSYACRLPTRPRTTPPACLGMQDLDYRGPLSVDGELNPRPTTQAALMASHPLYTLDYRIL